MSEMSPNFSHISNTHNNDSYVSWKKYPSQIRQLLIHFLLKINKIHLISSLFLFICSSILCSSVYFMIQHSNNSNSNDKNAKNNHGMNNSNAPSNIMSRLKHFKGESNTALCLISSVSDSSDLCRYQLSCPDDVSEANVIYTENFVRTLNELCTLPFYDESIKEPSQMIPSKLSFIAYMGDSQLLELHTDYQMLPLVLQESPVLDKDHIAGYDINDNNNNNNNQEIDEQQQSDHPHHPIAPKQQVFLSFPRSFSQFKRDAGKINDIREQMDLNGDLNEKQILRLFGQRKQTAIWRGTTTGVSLDFTKSSRPSTNMNKPMWDTLAFWHGSCRGIISTLSEDFPQLIDAGITATLQGIIQSDHYYSSKTMNQPTTISWLKNMKNNQQNTKQQQSNIRTTSPRIRNTLSDEEQMQHKFILMCDGNGVPDRLPRQMFYGTSVILRCFQSFKQEWWYSKLKNWEHYIQVTDGTHLLHLLGSFQENPAYWNPILSRIALNGRRLIQEIFTDRAMYDHTARTLQAYKQQFGTELEKWDYSKPLKRIHIP